LDLNVLIRGQSNALLFADRGGDDALEQGLEARLPGVDVHMLSESRANANTIFSATAFMDWDTGGQQDSLLRYVNGLPADIKDNPTATLWMHNEYDQQIAGLTTDAWLREVRADAALVRGALGQGAGTTPYEFVPIRYPYGGSFDAIKAGMEALDADPAFNASISWAAWPLAMDGGPEPGANSSHMGAADALRLGSDLAVGMAEVLRPLAAGWVGPRGASPAAVEVMRFYETALDRLPDAGGLGHWIPAREHGLTLGQMADAFTGSAEFQARYGALSDAGFVERLYLNALDRPGDAEGIAHWTDDLAAGALSRAEVVVGFAFSAEMAAKLAPLAGEGIVFV
jgi:hypothetical protein